MTKNFCENQIEEVDALGGGGLVAEEHHFSCQYCLFGQNSADYGGGVLVYHRRAQVTLEYTKFILNHAQVSGGALAQEHCGSSTISSCEFNDNTAVTGGGAIFSLQSGPLTVSVCHFTNNTCSSALSRGGTVLLDQGRLTLSNDTIEHGLAGYGGCIYTTEAVLTISTGRMMNCEAWQQGGGIEVTSSTELKLEQFEISDCIAKSGGGIFASALCSIELSDCVFKNLNVNANGGAIYLEYTSTIVSTNSTFQYNTGGMSLPRSQ